MGDADHNVLFLQKSLHPELAEEVDEIDRLATQKLFHQMTTGLEALVVRPCYQVAGNTDLVALFASFVKPFKPHIADLRFIRLMQSSLEQMEPAVAVEAMSEFEDKWEGVPKQVYQIVKGGLLAKGGQFEEAKEVLTQLREELEGTLGIDSFVFAQLYRGLAAVGSALGETTLFYETSLLRLAYTPVAEFPAVERPHRAVEIAEAALLSPLEFNFGELIEQPLMVADLGETSEHKRLLQAFHEGSFEQFDAILAEGGKMVAHKATLTNKMQLAALRELVFAKSKRTRVVTFAEIAAACRIPLNGVEFVVMKAMSLKLVSGSIDEVDQVVQFTSVKPRVLDKPRIELLKTRLETWASSATALTSHLDDLTPELLVA